MQGLSYTSLTKGLQQKNGPGRELQ